MRERTIMAPGSMTTREPRVVAFIVTGALLGFLLGAGIYLLDEDNGQYSARTAFGYLAVFGLLVGALLGAFAAAIVAGRRR
ncbi:hypothetical protein [Nostocoides australiense]|nr:hypothetical protein [Actinomycetota bacterium]HPF80544.1 hypothetical protein [Tetrasphaera australiensis]